MAVYYSALARYADLAIEPETYTLLSFPDTSADFWGMASKDRKLIVPEFAGVGCLELNVIWEAARYTELRDVFTRNPFGKGEGADDRTGYDHRVPSPGVQCFTKTHWLQVHPKTPLGVYVWHDGLHPVEVTHAQFKLTIFT